MVVHFLGVQNVEGALAHISGGQGGRKHACLPPSAMDRVQSDAGVPWHQEKYRLSVRLPGETGDMASGPDSSCCVRDVLHVPDQAICSS